MTEAEIPVYLVRLLAGIGVPESLRVIHIVPGDQMAPAVMVAYCYALIWRGTAEPVDGSSGAVCERCAFKAPIPGIDATSHEVTTVSNPQAPAVPLPPPEVQALLRKGRTTADRTLIAHVSRNGRCPICCCASPCAPAQLADLNREFMS